MRPTLPIFRTHRPIHGMVNAMTKTLGVLITAAALALGGSAAGSALGGGPSKTDHGCKVLNTTSTESTRNVSGVVIGMNPDRTPIYGRGIQTVTKTVTTKKCRGKVSTTTTYTVKGG